MSNLHTKNTSQLSKIKQNLFTLALVVVGFVYGLFILRSVDLQIIQRQYFQHLAGENRDLTEIISPNRGVLTDRYGNILAANQEYYWLSIDGHKFSVSHTTAMSEMATESAQVIAETGRRYPLASVSAQTLGYIGKPTVTDLLARKNLTTQDSVGKSGLEWLWNDRLLGQSGKKIWEVDALGRKIKILTEEAQKPGQTIRTTLDSYLSLLADRLMTRKRGALVILDADSGEVLVMNSYPSFNPEVLSPGQSANLFPIILANPDKPLFNRVISGLYAPGSVFKIVTALSSLENDPSLAQAKFEDTGVLKVGEYSYANWFFTQYGRTEGSLSLQKAISRSNDIVFYELAEKVGPTELATWAKRLGLGKTTGIGLPGESVGLVPDPEWKQKTLGQPWFLGNTYHMGIGQGDLQVTPVQLARLGMALLHGGKICQLKLERFSPSDPGAKLDCEDSTLSEPALDLVLKGMLDACSTGGTGFPVFPHNVRWRSVSQFSERAITEIEQGAVACKTGTAEFGGVNAEGFRQTNALFLSLVGLPENLLSSQVAGNLSQAEKQKSLLALTDTELRKRWLSQVAETGFPRRLVFLSLVESDEANQFQEGSRDAGPVVAQLINWIFGE